LVSGGEQEGLFSGSGSSWEDLGCVEADAVPARGGGLRLGLVEEGDGAELEAREVQRLPPSFIIPTTNPISLNQNSTSRGRKRLFCKL